MAVHVNNAAVDMFVPDDIAGEARAIQLAAERQQDIEKHTVRWCTAPVQKPLHRDA